MDHALLIDSTHKRWFIGTSLTGAVATILYFWLTRHSPGGLTGGSTVGLWYGIGGALLLIFAGLLAAHRRFLKWPWVPRRSWWLKGHIWLGLLSAVLILCHGGFRWGGALEKALLLVFGLTLVTGIFGLWLQQFLPRLLATRVPMETPYEQIPHVSLVLRRRADSLIDELCAPLNENKAGPHQGEVALDESACLGLREFFEREVRPFLHDPYSRSSALAHPMRAEAHFARLYAMPGLVPVKDRLARLEKLCEERRNLDDQERIYLWLHGWLLVHVPLSVALLVLGAAHALGSLYF